MRAGFNHLNHSHGNVGPPLEDAGRCVSRTEPIGRCGFPCRSTMACVVRSFRLRLRMWGGVVLERGELGRAVRVMGPRRTGSGVCDAGARYMEDRDRGCRNLACQARGAQRRATTPAAAMCQRHRPKFGAHVMVLAVLWCNYQGAQSVQGKAGACVSFDNNREEHGDGRAVGWALSRSGLGDTMAPPPSSLCRRCNLQLH
ncbi:hypothetical protein B0I37DRAFT_21651 [Chaetomium sp. MPI-CAGE-AT-0009]|nr:hypothetical protein B0I37DRAFT_21651 [Chaetomium sp. MPI-CAGE-AT-0009]